MSPLIAERGTKSESAETLQRKLGSLGLYDGPCDRCYNDELHAAVKQFQLANGLATGELGCDQATFDMITNQAGWTFHEVFQVELAAMRPCDMQPDADVPTPGCADFNSRVIKNAHQRALAGLAFSGGGIRSATFNLGIIEALAQTRMLGKFDYLSTVSGGGYIGSWLSRWIGLHQRGVEGVEDEIAQRGNGQSAKCEPRQIKFLRQYSNYLTPKAGLFSADTWAFLATYLRNTSLNLLILGLALAAVVIMPRMWVRFVAGFDADYLNLLWFSLAAFLFAVFNIAFGISVMPDPDKKTVQGQGWVIGTVVFPLMLAAAAGSVGLWLARADIIEAWKHRSSGFDLTAALSVLRDPAALLAPEYGLPMLLVGPGVVYFLVWTLGWGAAQWRNWRRHETRPHSVVAQAVGHFLFAVGAIAVGAALIITAAVQLPQAAAGTPPSGDLSHLASFGMPFMLSIFGVTMVLLIGLIGRLYTDKSREWWSRQGGWTIIFVLAWTVLFLFSLYSPVVVMWMFYNASGWGSAMAGGWLGAIWASLKAAKSPATGKPGASPYLEYLALCGPPLAAVAIFTAVSAAVFLVVTVDDPGPGSGLFGDVMHAQLIAAEQTKWQVLGWCLAACIAVSAFFAWRVDVNKFSLYMMYRNRLVRAYLGAINPAREPHPFTGFDSTDDIALHRLAGTPGKLQKPYLIINTALNLVGGKELAWQTRKAANFVFTPRFSGYETPRMSVSATASTAEESSRGMFRRTECMGVETTDADPAEKGVKLGMAMALSGAAASPSMGYHSAPALSFLMTLFNVRLGRWCGNPSTKDGWKKASPRFGVFCLFKELLGQTHARSKFLYLSDGGHFENLGIYELVRRRCRLIVAIDASADSKLDFGDLGNAVRKCYTDFNIEIDIDVKDLELAAGFSKAYCVAGKILYSSAQEGGPDGTLLYIKPSLLGTEFVDLLNYHKTNQAFPHQSTADQWFDETQFESYRSLGHHVGNNVFSRLVAAPADGTRLVNTTRQMCEAIEKYWPLGKAIATHSQDQTLATGAHARPTIIDALACVASLCLAKLRLRLSKSA